MGPIKNMKQNMDKKEKQAKENKKKERSPQLLVILFKDAYSYLETTFEIAKLDYNSQYYSVIVEYWEITFPPLTSQNRSYCFAHLLCSLFFYTYLKGFYPCIHIPFIFLLFSLTKFL
jgi:hypothetical protein